MKIRITKDFVIGVLFGAAGTLWMTSKKFADLLRAEKVEPEVVEEPIEDEKTDDVDPFFNF